MDITLFAALVFVLAMGVAVAWKYLEDEFAKFAVLGMAGATLTEAVNAVGQLLTSSPLLAWDNIIGILAASYTVAGNLGLPEEAVTYGAAVLALLFLVKLLYVGATTATEKADQI